MKKSRKVLICIMALFLFCGACGNETPEEKDGALCLTEEVGKTTVALTVTAPPKPTIMQNPTVSPEPSVTASPTATISVMPNTDEQKEETIMKSEKPRVINITDLIADPDDEQSLVRMFVTSNEVDIEGLIVSTSCWRRWQDAKGMAVLEKIIDAYEEVYPNLCVHADGYPTPEYIRSIAVFGQKGNGKWTNTANYGMDEVGKEWDSEGSELIIKAVDADDSRPVWINLWGGASTLAQALYKVRETRSTAEVNEFVSKIRVYDVLGQDDAGAWIVTEFPEIIYIRSKQVYGLGVDDNWIDENVQSHGALGAVYPDRKYASEGDTPSFLYQLSQGLTDIEHPEWGSWGGRFTATKIANIKGMDGGFDETVYGDYYMFGDAKEGNSGISRWKDAYQNDFEARMDWSITDNYSKANHHPIAVLNGDTTKDVLKINASGGDTIQLSAMGTSDPDNDVIKYKWYIYNEPSDYSGKITIDNPYGENTDIIISDDTKGEVHIILEVTDGGEPKLYAYRRAVITIN